MALANAIPHVLWSGLSIAPLGFYCYQHMARPWLCGLLRVQPVQLRLEIDQGYFPGDVAVVEDHWLGRGGTAPVHRHAHGPLYALAPLLGVRSVSRKS